MWLSGGQELCVWSEDFQLQCHRQNHSDNGEIVAVNPPDVSLLLHTNGLTLSFFFLKMAFCRNNCITGAAKELRGWGHGQGHQ